MLDHFANDVEIGDAVAYALLVDGIPTLGYLKISEITADELRGCDLAGEPSLIPTTSVFAVVLGLSDRRPPRRVRYR